MLILCLNSTKKDIVIIIININVFSFVPVGYHNLFEKNVISRTVFITWKWQQELFSTKWLKTHLCLDIERQHGYARASDFELIFCCSKIHFVPGFTGNVQRCKKVICSALRNLIDLEVFQNEDKLKSRSLWDKFADHAYGLTPHHKTAETTLWLIIIRASLFLTFEPNPPTPCVDVHVRCNWPCSSDYCVFEGKQWQI